MCSSLSLIPFTVSLARQIEAISLAYLEHSLYLTVGNFSCWRQRHGRRRDAKFLEPALQSGGSEENEHPQLLRFDREGVLDAPWEEDHRSRRSLDGAIADGNGHLALQHVERFLFPMMDVRRRNIAFSGDRLDQRELPLGVFGCSQEGHQPTAVADRPVQRLPSSTKRGGFFDFGVYFDLGCHDRLLSILRVLFAAAQQTIPDRKRSRS